MGRVSAGSTTAGSASAGSASAGPRVLLGLTGAPGAGKSTLAGDLARALTERTGEGAVAVVPMDGFHLADVILDALGLRDRKGAPETFDADGYAALLARLRSGGTRPVYAPGFERDLEQPLAAAVTVPASARVVVTEGNYLLLDDPRWHAVAAALDETWFVETDDAVRRERLVARHVRFGKSADAARDWVDRVDQPNADLVATTRGRADLVVRLDG
ncbi:nucleoside/nucleotide kinase family protein [Nocardioides sp. HDW12B]|nr:nucleoside/nucleotide kinase family protein [Nocardioides sp. HDW12B]